MNDDQRQVLTDLFEAARSDDISSCKVAVANGADINFAKVRDKTGLDLMCTTSPR